MNKFYAQLLISVVFFLTFSQSYACGVNEYESCWRVDLGPFGTAKDCKCLPKIGGTVGQAGEESKRAVGNVARELGKTPEAIQSCLSNVSQCANEILSAPLAIYVQAYIEGLYRQSEGRTRSFSPEFIALAQPYYNVDLSRITYADDINTGSGMSVSYCDRIFFAGHGSLWQDKNELHHVLHELEHTIQCQNRGKRTYLAEYVLKAGLDVVKTGRLNVHDVHDFEVAAEGKANRITDMIWSQIQNNSVQNLSTGTPLSQPQTMPQPMIPVRFCQTQMGTCSIPPAMVPMGTACFCNGQYGQMPGTAF